MLGKLFTRNCPDETRMIHSLAIAVPFHFKEDRLQYLRQTAAHFGRLADHVDVTILTNAQDAQRQARIRALFSDPAVDVQIMTPTLLGHPKLLTWCHRPVLKDRFNRDASVTHFMYVEDDICVQPHNIAYWLQAREKLRAHRLIPSFLRYEELVPGAARYSTDVTRRLALRELPQIKPSPNYAYLNLPQPYQGMYLLDRELMQEHIEGPSWDPNFGPWGIMEKATQGLTFEAVPSGFTSRNLIGFDLTAGQIDANCLIHHTPNNYVHDPRSKFGKVLIRDLIMMEPATVSQAT